MQTRSWLSRPVAVLALVFGLLICGGARAACLDISGSVTLEGALTFHIFGGPPYNGGVRLGDTPEPSYILQLDRPVCVSGDDLIDANAKIDRVQIFPDDSGANASALWSDLRRLVGQRVRVEGKSAFGAHTGHHHAPLLLPIASVTRSADPTEAYGTAMTTVQAFYQVAAKKPHDS